MLKCLIERPARFFMLAALLGTVACGDDDDDPAGPGPPVTITSGTPVTGITGGEDSQKLYKIVVPSGATLLAVTTTGGTGDVDLYIRHASNPTVDDFDCSSEGFDNEEYCEAGPPAAGDWFILLYGWAAYSGVTLTAVVTTP